MDSCKSNEKKIYVSNIPKHVDSKQLQLYFESFGSVYSAVVIGAKKGKSLSYGFVSFSSRKSLEAVMATEHQIEGFKLCVDSVSIEKAKTNLVKYANGEDTNVFLFVQDIPKDVNRRLLVEHFKQFGDLTKARLVTRPDKSKDFIYLQYKCIDSAATAKSQKHRIPELSKENITLVCKVGIFRNEKQIVIMEEAEDLLSDKCKQTSVTRTTEDISYGRQTDLNINCQPCATNNSYKKAQSARQTHGLVELLDQQRVKSSVIYLTNEKDIARASEIFSCNLDESEDNYRFNMALARFTDLIEMADGRMEQEADLTDDRTRLRSDHHITLEDVLRVQDISSAELPFESTVGAIGSERISSKPVVGDGFKPGAMKKLATALRGLGSRFYKPCQ